MEPGTDRSFETYDSTAQQYNDYKINIDNDVVNPDFAYLRDDGSFDMTYRDPTPYDLTDVNLWKEYESYTTKFEIAVYNNEGTLAESNAAYNSRNYGVLNSVWLGFSETLDLLWILDEDGDLIDDENPIEVIAGLQSNEFFVATGIDLSIAQNNPCLITSVSITPTSSWIQFGLDNEDNVLYKNEYILPFRINAFSQDAGTIKYVDWGELV